MVIDSTLHIQEAQITDERIEQKAVRSSYSAATRGIRLNKGR
jgi:hypothetical protein